MRQVVSAKVSKSSTVVSDFCWGDGGGTDLVELSLITPNIP